MKEQYALFEAPRRVTLPKIAVGERRVLSFHSNNMFDLNFP
jgi:hypothetical protein